MQKLQQYLNVWCTCACNGKRRNVGGLHTGRVCHSDGVELLVHCMFQNASKGLPPCLWFIVSGT